MPNDNDVTITQADELAAIDARLRAVPTQDECSRAVNDLLRFMDKHGPAIIAFLRSPPIEAPNLSHEVEAEREACAKVADDFERQENDCAWDKRQAGRDDSFNCARASAAQHIAAAIRNRPPIEAGGEVERTDDAKAADHLSADITVLGQEVERLREALFHTQAMLETIVRTNSTCMSDVHERIIANRDALTKEDRNVTGG